MGGYTIGGEGEGRACNPEPWIIYIYIYISKNDPKTKTNLIKGFHKRLPNLLVSRFFQDSEDLEVA